MKTALKVILLVNLLTFAFIIMHVLLLMSSIGGEISCMNSYDWELFDRHMKNMNVIGLYFITNFRDAPIEDICQGLIFLPSLLICVSLAAILVYLRIQHKTGWFALEILPLLTLPAWYGLGSIQNNDMSELLATWRFALTYYGFFYAILLSCILGIIDIVSGIVHSRRSTAKSPENPTGTAV